MRNRVVAARDRLRVARLRHHDRALDLCAGLFRDRARPLGERGGPDADPVHGRRGDRLDRRRAADGAAHALQAHRRSSALPFAVAVAAAARARAGAARRSPRVGALLLVTGAGIGTVLPITTVSVQNAVLPWQLGTVTGVINFMRALASALLVALYGAFLFGGAAQGRDAGNARRRRPRRRARTATSAGSSPRPRSASRSRGCCCWRWRSARCARTPRGKGSARGAGGVGISRCRAPTPLPCVTLRRCCSFNSFGRLLASFAISRQVSSRVLASERGCFLGGCGTAGWGQLTSRTWPCSRPSRDACVRIRRR